VALGPLTEAEARELIGSGAGAMSEDDVAWMLEHSGRWPLLVQIGCEEWHLAREDGQTGDEWRAEALRRIAPFAHLLPLEPNG